MNLPSANYIARCVKPPRYSRGGSSRAEYIAPDHCGPYNVVKSLQRPDINKSSTSEHNMVSSEYSDAGDTFAARLSNGAADDVSDNIHHDIAGSFGPHGGGASADDGSQSRHKDAGASRDFILKRFLPAAQAMTTTDKKALPSHIQQDRSADSSLRPKFASSVTTSSRPPGSANFEHSSSTSSRSSKFTSRFVREVKQDVTGFSDRDVEDEERLGGACGFPLHLGRLALLQFRTPSFWSSRSSSSSRSKMATQTASTSTSTSTKKLFEVIRDEASDNSDDLFWSDEEAFEDAMSHDSKAPGMSVKMDERDCHQSNMGAGSSAEMMRKGNMLAKAPAPRLAHSMATVHTPDHRGFLGVPKNSMANILSTGAELERAKQVDRLGARLTQMLSKANYVMPDQSTNPQITAADHVDHHQNYQCVEGGKSSSAKLQPGQPGISPARPAAKKTTSSPATSKNLPHQKTKWVDAVASLRPPPSPKMPSESWLSNTLPPERLLIVKKLSRKPLGSFIPIKPPVKPTSLPTRDQEESSLRIRQSCSLKEHLNGRQILSPPTMQAV